MAKRKKQSNGEGTIITVAFIISVMTSIGALVWVAILFQEQQSFLDEQAKLKQAAEKSAVVAATERYMSLTVQPFIGAEDTDRAEWLSDEPKRNEIGADIKAKADNLETSFKAFQQSYPGLVPNGAEVIYSTSIRIFQSPKLAQLNSKLSLHW